MFWTPVVVAPRAAQFRAPDQKARVLDIGSGVEKLCIIGAACTDEVGIVSADGRGSGVAEALHLAFARQTPGHGP